MTQDTIDSQTQEKLEAINAFEKQTGYDATYMKQMLAHAPDALEIFNGFVPMAGHRKHAPLDVYYVAKLTAYRHCDCGPCLQLALDYAKQDGISREIRERIAYDRGTLSSQLEEVRAFALAVLTNDPTCEDLRQNIEFSYGKATVIELALTIAAPQIFPVIKRAMGLYKSCSMVNIDA